MSSRPEVVAAARALNALFFISVAAYALLAYIPFTYSQFIKPDIIPAIADFVSLSPAVFWLVLLITVLTLFPRLQRPARSVAAIAYVAVWAALGVWVLIEPLLKPLHDSPWSLVVALLALAAPVSLAVVDFRLMPAVSIVGSNTRRAAVAILGAGLLAWAVFAIAVPLRLHQAVGIALSARELAIAFAGSAAAVVAVFAALSLIALALSAAARFSASPGRTEYSLLIAMLAASLAAVLYELVCASIAFNGAAALLASSALAGTAAVVWADLGRVRASQHDGEPFEALSLFATPVIGCRPSRGTMMLSVAALPIIAFVLVSAVVHLDWNFLLQKLTVLLVWLAAVAIVQGIGRSAEPVARHQPAGNPFARQDAVRSAKALAERFRDRAERHALARHYAVLAPVIALAACALVSLALNRAQPQAGRALDVESALDRYAAVDPSYRLIRDAWTVPSGETARFYAHLHANTLVPPAAARPAAVDFVVPLRAAPGPKPFIFLFIIDSLRRDYLSAYNPAVGFTPQIARFASDSVVFNRAFARYAGTALAVPSIWSGGMMIHELEPHDFGGRNALLKLLDADGYHQVLTMDHIIKDLMPDRQGVTELDPALPDIERDLCRTAGELAPMLTDRRDPRPMFVYTLPQNDHIAVASKRKVPSGESYPGFFAPVASSVRYVDGCFGGFIDDLKRAGLYDRSIILLTSDHGDSLGEEGRWGHAFFLDPEVMRVPLIVHLPSSLRERVSVDPDAVAFSTDITPTLYALLGHQPRDLGPLFGRSLFGPAGAAPPRRTGPFLLASSYGAVYAILRNNGTFMYTSDAEDARDFAFDVSGNGPGVHLALTADMTATNRQLIREQLSQLAALNHFTP